MPQEPKRRHSKQRKGKRRSSIRLKLQKTATCPNCGKPMLPHMACKSCGYYKGVEIIKEKPKKKKEE